LISATAARLAKPPSRSRRADRVIARARAASGDVALLAHRPVLRVPVSRWIGLPASAGQHFRSIRAPCAFSAIIATHPP
jgi:hypothetical protein